jgi:hypothetical protein
MIAGTQPAAAFAVKAFVTVKKVLGRCVCALAEARMRRIQHEIEFQRRINDYRRANGMPPLAEKDLRGRF